MSAVNSIVVLGGIAAIVWVNWYFFFAERSAATVAGARKADASGSEGSSADDEGHGDA